MDQSICRLCNENIGIISLFVSVDAALQLSTKVMHLAKITIVQDDGLPANICASCEENLVSAYSFVVKCEETDQKLRALELTIKQECEKKCDLKIEGCDTNDSYPPENIFDDGPDSSPLVNIKVEEEHPSEVRTKRKYVKRSNIRRESIKCKVCGRMCINRSTLVVHMRSHTNEKPYTCPSCEKSYKDSGTLKRHIERNHNDGRQKTVICEHCGKGFYSRSDCKIHKRVHTGETPYPCTKCPAQFTQLGSLQRHTLIHTGERSHMCSKCSKNFSTRVQLRKHYLVHTNEKKFKCPLCNVPFKYDNNMRKHIKLHSEGMIKKFTCDHCSCSFISKGTLQGHIKRKHSTKSGYCRECSKHVSNLEMHMWRHAGLRPIKCELCTSSFFDLKGLSTHVSFRHKSVDKFKCTADDCTVTFPSQAMLDYHVLRYHKNIKPFSCDKCPRCFYRNSDLARHKNNAHK